MLKEQDKNKGTQGQLKGKDSSGGNIIQPPENNPQKLEEIGISKNQSSSWQRIAEIFDISIGSVNEIINKFKNLHLHDSEKDFKPFIYNIWKLPKSAFQRCELALELEDIFKAKAKENLSIAGQSYSPKEGCQKSDKVSDPIDTKKEVAKIAGVSHDTIAKAKKIQDKAPEEARSQTRKG